MHTTTVSRPPVLATISRLSVLTTISRLPIPWRKRISYAALGAGLLMAGLLSGAAMNTKGLLSIGSGGGKVPIYIASDSRVTDPVTLNAGFAPVAKTVMPAVVTVQTSSRVRRQQIHFFGEPVWPFDSDPFHDFFFRRGTPDDDESETPRRPNARRLQSPEDRGHLEPTGIGSGVIVSPDGYILTNNHVVDGADKVEVTLNDRRNFTARVVGVDPPSDIAALKIDGGSFPTLTIGDSNKVEVGDVVLAVGNPLGVGQTITMGIISAKGRSTSASSGSGSYEDFLQTDAAINRGNSGGALVNLKGELIGIPSQILSQTGGNIGIGFAIPTAMARSVMDQLIKNGKVRRGKLGVTIGDLTPEMASQFGFKGTQGALVQDTEPGQAAERAGVKAGDIFTEFQGQRIEDSSRLRNLVAQAPPGSTVRFKVWRDGSERELTATLSEMDPKAVAAGLTRGGSSPTGGALSGVSVESLTSETARRWNLPQSARGVVITEVDPDSGAAGAGLERGDVIEEVNRQPVANAGEFEAALKKAGKQSVLLRVRRGDHASFVVVKPRE
ncbi:MAG: DegQ family serine endoprotease [Chloracidobacterium sp.]|nr:DegQ family serine endoprotease [Chloracidobacterium sp.]